jgi:cell division protein FtsI (penicillin-binding protein 3)
VIDASSPIKYAGFTISDSHAKNRPLTVPEVFMYSSNIGTAKIAQSIGRSAHQEFLKKMGLMQPIDIGLPEMPRPLYPSARNWGELSTMTISFGHGMSVTPAHIVQAMQTMVNGGKKVPLTVFRRNEPAQEEQLISTDTSYRMRQLLRLVVERGTGSKSEVPGYWIGGKTGTAEKVTAHGYSENASLSSFIGAFPIHDPRYVVLVMLDEPKGTKQTFGYATGGWTAAPTVSRVVARIGPMLGVKPEQAIAQQLSQLHPDASQQTADRGVNLAAYQIRH